MADESNQNNSQTGNRSKSRGRNRNRNRKKSTKPATDNQAAAPQVRVGPEPADDVAIHDPKKYGVLFFETAQAAKDSVETIAAKVAEYDQLNVVIRQEWEMDDPDFLKLEHVKVFAGTAWSLIHDRRIEDGWYQSAH